MTQDYGVPTAYVPRPTARTEDVPTYAPEPVDKPKVDPVQKAVDDWIETQRKAKAWDLLRASEGTLHSGLGRSMDKVIESVKGTEK